MAYKLISLLVVAFTLANTEAVSLKKTTKGERIADLYVKDGDSGELRFLGAGGLVGGGNSNAQLNQYITQKQNLLEQLRPTTTSGFGTGTGITGTGITGTGITGTGITGTGITGTGTGIGTGSVAPIIINAGGTSGSATNTASNSAIVGGSPIASLLPQIIAQAAVTRRGPNNNRRRVNQRRRNNRRRPNRGGNKKGAYIYVVRPRA